MHVRDFQRLIDAMYSARDRERGAPKTFLWFMEEVGELASAIAEKQPKEHLAAEFADVMAWLVTLANVEDVDLESALIKYSKGCPGCAQMACVCEEKLV